MLHNHLFTLQNVLRENKILISFSGKLSQGLIEEYGQAVKKYLENEELPRNEVYHTFSIFIELTQNIKNYCSRKESYPFFDELASSCIIAIGKMENGHFVCSGNLIENSDIDVLKNHIDPLLTMDKAELKQLYKQTLKKEITPDCSGAGLGLIEIARKASEPLMYSITPINDHFSFYTLRAAVRREDHAAIGH